MKEEYLLLGYITDAFSLDGTFKVLSKTDFAEKRYQKGKEVFLYQPNTKQRMTVVVENYRKGLWTPPYPVLLLCDFSCLRAFELALLSS